MGAGRQRTNPMDGALARLADLAGRGVQPARMSREVETIVATWRDSADDLSEHLSLLHEQLVAGVEAAAEQLSDVDRSDGGALRHAGLVHAALLAVVAAVERALEGPRSRPDARPVMPARALPPRGAPAAGETRTASSLFEAPVTIPPLAERNPQGVDHSHRPEVQAVAGGASVGDAPAADPPRGRKKRTKKTREAEEKDLYSATG